MLNPILMEKCLQFGNQNLHINITQNSIVIQKQPSQQIRINFIIFNDHLTAREYLVNFGRFAEFNLQNVKSRSGISKTQSKKITQLKNITNNVFIFQKCKMGQQLRIRELKAVKHFFLRNQIFKSFCSDVMPQQQSKLVVEVSTNKMNSNNKPKVIFILGGPGSGKGTQCDIMTSRYGYEHLSTGDLLREFVKTDCQDAVKIREFIAQGKLAPSQMLVNIVKKAIFKNGPNNNIYLVDGFPRSAQNYEAWTKVMGQEVDVRTLLYLQCSLETLQARLLQRGKSSGRLDDNLQTIRKRFKTYNEQTMPFLEYYKRNIGEIHMINGQNSVQSVSQKIRQILVGKQLLEKPEQKLVEAV